MKQKDIDNLTKLAKDELKKLPKQKKTISKVITKNKEEFSYCIGRHWDKKDPNNISVYAYGQSVFHGTMKDALEMKKFIDNRCDDKWKYNIYKLVKIDEK